MSFFDQSSFTIRCEWGDHALTQLAPSEVVVIVDVLSFTTCVEIAVSRGAAVLPDRWHDASAADFAKTQQTELAGRRGDPSGRFFLSPVSVLNVTQGLRLVLPSPNGSALAFQASSSGSSVIAACLRNASAVGEWLRATARTVTVVPAGERWPDGAVLSRLTGPFSPEAKAAIAAFEAARTDLPATLRQTAGGCELAERGHQRDVELAAELDVSQTIPILRNGMFLHEKTVKEPLTLPP